MKRRSKKKKNTVAIKIVLIFNCYWFIEMRPPRTVSSLTSESLICVWLSFNSVLAVVQLGPSSLTHYLQIYCTELIGPRSHTSWAWAVNIPPTGSIWSISVHFNPTWAHTMPQCLTGKEWALLYGQHELMDNQFLKPSLPRLYSNKEKRKKKKTL